MAACGQGGLVMPVGLMQHERQTHILGASLQRDPAVAIAAHRIQPAPHTCQQITRLSASLVVLDSRTAGLVCQVMCGSGCLIGWLLAC